MLISGGPASSLKALLIWLGAVLRAGGVSECLRPVAWKRMLVCQVLLIIRFRAGTR